MLNACCDYVAGEFRRLLVNRFVGVLGPPGIWELRTRPINKNSIVIEFVYRLPQRNRTYRIYQANGRT